MSSQRDEWRTVRGGRGGRGGGGGDNKCFKCGKSGHMSRECPQSRGGGGGQGGDNKCFNCGGYGHMSRECPQPDRRSSGGGQQRGVCYGCGQSGHTRDNCPQARGGSSGGADRRGGGQGGRGYGSGGGGGYGGRAPGASGSTDKPYQPSEMVCRAPAQFVKRPDTGGAGTLIDLIVNHFRLVIKDIVVYHYHVEFECSNRPLGQAVASAPGAAGGGDGERESKAKTRKLRQKENRLVFAAFMDNKPDLFGYQEAGAQKLQKPVFDGNSNVYTKRLLSGLATDGEYSCSISVEMDGKPQHVKVTIKYTQSIDLSAINLYYDGQSDNVPREAMQALDIILRYGPTTDRIPIGNSLYPKWETWNGRDNSRVDIDDVGNKQVVFGHYQSTRLTKMGPTILVDRSATAFFAGGTLLDFMRRLKDRIPVHRRQDDRAVNDSLLRDAKGLRVYTNHLGYKRCYTIKGLSVLPPHKQTFEYDDDGGRKVKTTVKEYFQKAYPNVAVNDREFPCLIPQANKTIYLPMDACYLFPDQPVSRGKLDAYNTSKMVRECGTKSPVERFDAIMDAVTTIKAASERYLMEFNLDIDTHPVQIPGRVLNPPATKGLDRRQGLAMHRTVSLRHWVFVNLCERFVDDRAVGDFVSGLCGQAARAVGMTVEQPTKVFRYDRTGPRDIANIFVGARTECRRKGGALQMILFVIPDDSVIYNAIKHVGDCNEGIVTQCVKSKNVARPPKGGVQSNLLLKINTKLGGINRILDQRPDKPEVLRKPNWRVMIIGADVTHPAPADKLETSVAACIGSIDADHCKYSATIRAQERTTRAQAVEMIKEFDLMIRDLLGEYTKALGGLPNHIIYYRDGVSESQFETVLDYERRKLLEGCRAEGCTPKVTFITVQKRHHTRFRPMDAARGIGRMRNIPPGTTVDSHVVHPTDFDFYLCSHEGIQGTSRPTHYYVLHDDYGFKADELQKLSYYLCYVYARCDKPISIPAPVQYAHLAAYRARSHIVAYNQGGDGPSRPARDETEPQRRHRENELAADLNRRITVNATVKNNMYYC